MPPRLFQGKPHHLRLQKLHFEESVRPVLERAEQFLCRHALILKKRMVQSRIRLRMVLPHRVVPVNIRFRHDFPEKVRRSRAEYGFFGNEARKKVLVALPVIRKRVLRILKTTQEELDELRVVRRSDRFGSVPVAAVGAGRQESPRRIELVQNRRNDLERSSPPAIGREGVIAADGIFIVAGPPDETRMVPQRFRGEFRFFPQCFPEPGFLFRILAAGHQEILGDEESEPVAFPIKMPGSEDAAAPDAKHVDAGFGGPVQVQGFFFVPHFG